MLKAAPIRACISVSNLSRARIFYEKTLAQLASGIEK